MPTLAQIEEQIYACEGFRVRLTPFKATVKTIPAYDFLVMAPQRWRLSDWKTRRLQNYVTSIREIVVLRGDSTPVRTDVQLGNLRDTYYQAKYGSLVPGEVPLPDVSTLPPPNDPDATPPKRPTPRRRQL